VCPHGARPCVPSRAVPLVSSYADVHPAPVHPNMSLFQSLVQLGAGLSVGLAGLAAGFSIGIIGDAGVRGTGQQPKLFVAMVSTRAHTRTRGQLHETNSNAAVDLNAHLCGGIGSLRNDRRAPSKRQRPNLRACAHRLFFRAVARH
jgi:F0F1-type ATP synthase membrane subunit c/vacuolar-type H+-ATPase subunit K